MIDLAPRGVAGYTLLPIMDEDGLHDVQAGGPEHDGLLGRYADELAGEPARRGNALEAAVVAAIDAFVGEVGAARNKVEHGARDVYLSRARLATRHIERETARLCLLHLCLELGNRSVELLGPHLFVYRRHVHPLQRRAPTPLGRCA